ncbi:HlyD family secretion protein [Flavivirga jejuensis]|uniref:HlyD family efflux transporter periplasmic adaptor subunit n=1 Tax=Flavivirga jejuensis TaxID=870487 RepID=A0ABT8WKL8_9FLAO|nr:HlyD family efflux transporter periplasmic adaptor subunit [Flavivirga jejuensis]MDO5973497.1 HlyD family efflux transporter periplasmic adaptor subunit [Flavivirga jejuensis]
MPDNSLEDIELRSEEVQEILTIVPHWMIRWGNVLFLALTIMLLLISWFVKYPDIITSEATITTQIPPQKEYAAITGNIDVLFVKDKQQVISNEPLAILENTANYKDVYKLKSIIDTLFINSKSFSFPIDSLPILFLGDIESQFALFENSYIQYKANKDLQPFSSKASVNQFTLLELNHRLKSLKSQRSINKVELEFTKKDLNRQKSLFDKGIISTQEYENKQLQYAQAERNYKNFEIIISQTKEAINNEHGRSKDTNVNRIKEEMILLKTVSQSLNQLKKGIKDWERLYVLKSDIEGKVSFLNYWNTKQAVNQGDLVFTIIPSKNSSFIAKLKVPAQNFGKIRVGQKVIIKLENYPDTEFGVLNGTVKNISLMPDEDGIYFVDVKLPKKLITSYNKEIDFKQEMKGKAEIITEDLRLIERFFYQFKEVVKR